MGVPLGPQVVYYEVSLGSQVLCYGISLGPQVLYYEGTLRSSSPTLKKKKEVCRTPRKRFGRFLKACKCVQSLKKRIKNSTESFEGSEEYPLAEPSLTKKSSVEKYETLRVQYETIRI